MKKLITKESIKGYVLAGIWTLADVTEAKDKGYITAEEFEELKAELPQLNG